MKAAVFGLIIASIAVSVWNSRSASPSISVLNRWARWLGLSLGAAYFVYDAGWLDRPFWALAVLFLLLWLSLETLYNWFMINALSQSNYALFPRYRENMSGEEWPAAEKFIRLRDWLRSHGFSKTQALRADVGNGLMIRSSVYTNADKSIRLQVLFVPQSNGLIGYSLSFLSVAKDEKRLITDNLHMPYGGFYPEDWEVSRKPWKRSVEGLYQLHCRRIEGSDLKSFDTDPLDDLNEQQRVLERINIDEGFLVPPHMQEEQGKITWEGRYRVWKEIWLLNYFGVSSSK